MLESNYYWVCDRAICREKNHVVVRRNNMSLVNTVLYEDNGPNSCLGLTILHLNNVFDLPLLIDMDHVMKCYSHCSNAYCFVHVVFVQGGNI